MLIVAHHALVTWNDYGESHYIGDINPNVTPHTVVEVMARANLRLRRCTLGHKPHFTSMVSYMLLGEM
jgi:hypothetical protein